MSKTYYMDHALRHALVSPSNKMVLELRFCPTDVMSTPACLPLTHPRAQESFYGPGAEGPALPLCST